MNANTPVTKTGPTLKSLLFICFSFFINFFLFNSFNFAQTALVVQEEIVNSDNLAISPDGKYMVAGYREKIQLYDLLAGHQIKIITLDGLDPISFHFLEKPWQILINGQEKVILFDLAEERILKELEVLNAVVHPGVTEFLCQKPVERDETTRDYIYDPKLYRYAIPSFDLVGQFDPGFETLLEYKYHPIKKEVYLTGLQNEKESPEYSADAVLRIFDLPTYQLQNAIPIVKVSSSYPIASINFSPNSRYANIYVSAQQEQLIFDVAQAQFISLKLPSAIKFNAFHFSPDDRYLCGVYLVEEEMEFTSKYSQNQNPKAQKLLVYDLQNDKVVLKEEDVSQVVFTPKGEYMLVIPSGFGDRIPQTVRALSLPSGRENFRFKVNRREVGTLLFSPDNRFFYFAEEGSLKAFDIDKQKVIRTLKGKRTPTSFPQFSLQDNTLFIPTEEHGLKIMHLDNVTNLEYLPFPVEQITVSNDGKLMAYPDSEQQTLVVRNMKTLEVLYTFELDKSVIFGKETSQLRISPHSKYLSFKTVDRNYFLDYYALFDLETGELLRLIPGSILIKNSVFTGPEDYLAIQRATCNLDHYPKQWTQAVVQDNQIPLGSGQQSIQIIDPKTGRVIHCWETPHPSRVMTNSPNGKYIAFVNTRREGLKATDIIEVLEPLSGKEPIVLEEMPSGALDLFLKFSADEKHLFYYHYVLESDGLTRRYVLDQYDLSTKKKTRVLDGLNPPDVLSFEFDISPDNRIAAFRSNNGLIDLWDLEKKELLFSIFNAGYSDYLIVTPDHYYAGTKDALDLVVFRNDMESYSFRQFDLRFNRPDLVLSKFPYSSEEVMNRYNNAYKKRMQRLGFGTEVKTAELQAPTVRILNESVPYATPNSSFYLKIEAEDQKYPLDRINIWVNDVPLFGRNGQSLKSGRKKTLSETYNIPLSQGPNQIQVSVLNAQGVESLVEELAIELEDPSAKAPSVYLVAIGVSAFENPAMNLKYASKDAQDLAKLLKRAGNGIHIETLLDQEVTPLNLQKIKTKLKQTRVDDQVILFVAGHGLVNQNLDYYFATAKTDFSNPDQSSIPYLELENLLDEIPARNKLFLMDACHSGEIDKTSVEFIQQDQLPEGEVTFRAVGNRPIFTKKELQNSFELMRDLFVDLRKGTGAHVISSASGVEFALEGDQWENGVFTFCLLNGLQNMDADLDKDGNIMVSELQQYLAKEVALLTHNQQRPTFRVRNISNDWRIWGEAENQQQLFATDVLEDGQLDDNDYNAIYKKNEQAHKEFRKGNKAMVLALLNHQEIDRIAGKLKTDKTIEANLKSDFLQLEYQRTIGGAATCSATNDDDCVKQYFALILKYWHLQFMSKRDQYSFSASYQRFVEEQHIQSSELISNKPPLEQAMLLNEVGNWLLSAGNFEQAETAYNKAIKWFEQLKKQPDNSWGMSFEQIDITYLLGVAYYDKYRLGKAEKDKLKADGALYQALANHQVWLDSKQYPEHSWLSGLINFYAENPSDPAIKIKSKMVLYTVYQRLIQVTPQTDYRRLLDYSQKSLDLAQELVALNNTTTNQKQLADSYGGLAWLQLFNRQFHQAIVSAQQGLAVDIPLAEKEWINTNLALAYLYSGDFEKAKKIYLELKDKPYADKTYQHYFLIDLEDLKKAGIYHPDVPKIEGILK